MLLPGRGTVGVRITFKPIFMVPLYRRLRDLSNFRVDTVSGL